MTLIDSANSMISLLLVLKNDNLNDYKNIYKNYHFDHPSFIFFYHVLSYSPCILKKMVPCSSPIAF